jgi:hypothetical protein
LENVLVTAVVDFYDKYPLGLRRTSRGQFILTDRRLVYIKFEHWWSSNNYATQIDDAIQQAWSLAIPIEQVIEAKIEHKIGHPYLHVTYRTATTEESACFLLVGTGTLSALMVYRSGPLEHIAKLIEQSKRSAGQQDSPIK